MNFYRLRFIPVLIVCTLLTTYTYAANVSNPADVQDVKSLMQIFQIDKSIQNVIRADIEQNNRLHPELYVDIETTMNPLTLNAISDRLAPHLANVIPKEYAKKLLKDLETPAGKNVLYLDRMFTEQGKNAAAAAFNKLSAAEKKATNDFRNGNGYRLLLNAILHPQPEIQTDLRAWAASLSQARIQKARQSMAAVLEKSIQADQEGDTYSSQLLPATIPKTGIRSIDTEMALTLEFYKKMNQIESKFSQEFNRTEFSKILDPQNLVSRTALEQAQLNLLTAESIIDQRAPLIEKLLKNYFEDLNNIPMPANEKQLMRAQNEREAMISMENSMKLMELTGKSIELRKQLLNLCQENLGKIKFEDQKLIFSDEAALSNYNQLVAQLNQNLDESQRFDRDRLDRKRSMARSLRLNK